MITRRTPRSAFLAPLVALRIFAGIVPTLGAPATAGETPAPQPPTTVASPPTVGGDTRLASCLEQARIDPPAARAKAEKWLDESKGSPAARLCMAMALFHDRAFPEAAERLEALADERMEGDPTDAVGLLGQAGWAWLRAGEAAKADSAYSRALEKRPDDPDMWIDRAFARAEVERYWDAIDDLDRAVSLAPDRFEAYLYRAAARQALSQPKAALEDVALSLERNPDDPRAILLRGNIKGESGDLPGAKADWELTVRLDGHPDGADGPSARAARFNLDRLEAGR